MEASRLEIRLPLTKVVRLKRVVFNLLVGGLWLAYGHLDASWAQGSHGQPAFRVAFKETPIIRTRIEVAPVNPLSQGFDLKSIPSLETLQPPKSNEQKLVPPALIENKPESVIEEQAPGKPGNVAKERPPQMPSYLPMQKPISQLDISVQSKAKSGNNTLPENLARQIQGDVPTVLAQPASTMSIAVDSTFTQHDSSINYQPLYFEEPNLERYGRSSFRLQPAASALRFYATIPALPYAMTVHRPNVAYNWKWPYEAGWGAPRVRELPPLQCKAGLVEAGAITGLALLVP